MYSHIIYYLRLASIAPRPPIPSGSISTLALGSLGMTGYDCDHYSTMNPVHLSLGFPVWCSGNGRQNHEHGIELISHSTVAMGDSG